MTIAASKQGLVAKAGEPGIDPRGPRFGAGITAVLLLVVIGLSLAGTQLSGARLVGAQLAATILFTVITALFAWGAFAGVARHPYGLFFKAVIRPRLAAPSHLENPKPPTFAQGVGFVITLVGLLLAFAQVPYALVIFGGLAFIAAFLNSVFDYCFGCQIYLLLLRLRSSRQPA